MAMTFKDGKEQTRASSWVTYRDNDGGSVDETDDEWRCLWLLVVLGLLVAGKYNEDNSEARQELDAKRLAFRDALSKDRTTSAPCISVCHVLVTWNHFHCPFVNYSTYHFLADFIGYWRNPVVRPAVCLSVCLAQAAHCATTTCYQCIQTETAKRIVFYCPMSCLFNVELLDGRSFSFC